jgi:PiT family inorganic phosphate transporter
MGVGSAERLSKVRWGVAGNIAVAWLVTIPATALMAAVLYGLLVRVSPVLLSN